MLDPNLWIQIKECLQKSNKNRLLKSILNATQLESKMLEGSPCFTLTVPSSFHKKIILSCLEDIQNYTRKQGLGDKIDIQQSSQQLALNTKASPAGTDVIKSVQKNSSVFDTWHFEDFIEGPGNTFALAAAKSVAQKSITKHSNPLFIYGSTGLGKTHLLLAIGNHIRKKLPEVKVHYLAAERFFNDCIVYMQRSAMRQFREKYRRKLDVLLLDDVQILGRGESTQEEFFHTFEFLTQNQCQIVLASDKKPKDIKGLKARIQSRFSGGLVVDIEPPDKETAMAIIKQKALKMNIELAQHLCLYLAELPFRSVREIEGYLNKIKIFCELQRMPLSLAVLKQLFAGSGQTDTSLPQVEEIQAIVANFFHLKVSDLKSKSRHTPIVHARNISMLIIREYLKLSLKQIGRLFGSKDHSSVLKALKKIRQEAGSKTKVKQDIQKIKTDLNL